MADLNRRRFLALGAVVWTTPTVLAVKPANAATLGSSPPKPPEAPSVGPPKPEQPVAPGPSELAFTGNDQARDALIAAGLLAAGTAALLHGETGEPDWDADE